MDASGHISLKGVLVVVVHLHAKLSYSDLFENRVNHCIEWVHG